MSEILKTNENISDIALAYFDEVDEVLKEVTEDNFYFALHPFTSQYRKLYLIGDMIYSNNIRVSAYSSDNYSVKVLFTDKVTSLEDFNEASDQDSFFFDGLYLNAIPVHILVTSESITYSDMSLNLTITVGEELPV